MRAIENYAGEGLDHLALVKQQRREVIARLREPGRAVAPKEALLACADLLREAGVDDPAIGGILRAAYRAA